MDGGIPPVAALAWPDGAKLEVTGTTATTADVHWPDAIGPVAHYRLTWPDSAQDVTATSFNFANLARTHLPVEVVAVAEDGTTTSPLRAEVAPAEELNITDGDISTDFCGANAFLKQGVDIPCESLSILLGHVRTRDGVGVPGMRISVLHHPEWGETTSQADGLYALAVAAGRHTLELRASAFIPLQRLVTAPARNFAYLPDTAVLRRDEKATSISMGTGGFHTATPQEDKDGKRTTSVFVPPGINASLRRRRSAGHRDADAARDGSGLMLLGLVRFENAEPASPVDVKRAATSREPFRPATIEGDGPSTVRSRVPGLAKVATSAPLAALNCATRPLLPTVPTATTSGPTWATSDNATSSVP
jgi:hypothetical protein